MKNTNYDYAIEQVHKLQHKILYEWSVDPAKWKESVKPMKAVFYKKSIVWIFRLFLLQVLLSISLLMLFYTDNIYMLILLFLISLLPGLLLFIVVIAPPKHEKYVHFVTNKGIYTGWVYCVNIYKYTIYEKEQKISLCIEYPFVRGNMNPMGNPYNSTTIWINFYYTEKDKLFIFQILAQWEKDKQNFTAKSVPDREYLHKYIEELDRNSALET